MIKLATVQRDLLIKQLAKRPQSYRDDLLNEMQDMVTEIRTNNSALQLVGVTNPGILTDWAQLYLREWNAAVVDLELTLTRRLKGVVRRSLFPGEAQQWSLELEWIYT